MRKITSTQKWFELFSKKLNRLYNVLSETSEGRKSRRYKTHTYAPRSVAKNSLRYNENK
jgi:hypothetical protein